MSQSYSLRRRAHRLCSAGSLVSLQSVVSCSLQTVSRWISFSHCNTAEIRVSLKVNSILKLFVAFFFFSVTATHKIKVHHLDTMKYMSTIYMRVCISSVQSLSHDGLFATPWIAACQASLSITNSQSSLKLTSIESVMPSSHLILCRPLFLLPSIPPSIRVFSNESTLRMRWPKYWSFSFSISPSSEHPGLIPYRMDWLGLLAVQGTLKSLL